MTKTKNKGGRPKTELSKTQVVQVEALAAYLTCEQIADYLSISSTTFKNLRKIIEPKTYNLGSI
jgi:DNA-binding CsgD family transcriptional regulator